MKISASLNNFHSVTREWFLKNIGVPTEAQAQAWPAIQRGEHTLIAAPTGSGKTMAAFYTILNELMIQGLHQQLSQQTQVVYVSPLKALSNDIHRNLEVPLNGLQEELRNQGYPPVTISVAVRTADTPSRERQKMLKAPPHILVTTPESLYLLLTSEGGRNMLQDVRILIIDEIHALIADKRGSHLSLSVERLAARTSQRLQRIGLSATQKPIDLVARFLVGSSQIKNNHPECTVIDTGHLRKMEPHGQARGTFKDVCSGIPHEVPTAKAVVQKVGIDIRLEVPKSPLSAVMSHEVWGEIYERLTELIAQHKTTLIFVNTRRLAERLAMALAERLGSEQVTSHHGSMSKEHRLSAEQRLKAGQLKVLVATASMELGIDIGSVELVVQFSSPRRIATFLQRVGRSGHCVGGIPKGIIFPLSREDLLECAALLESVRQGELDQIIMPEQPLDILSQQIIAEVAGQEWEVNGLYTLFRQAYPYRDLKKEQFLQIVRMLADGFTTRRGRRTALLYYDAINGRVKARPSARLIALTNGGAIPDTFDYEVVLQPEGITVGTLNEDFALESSSGDIFTLGTHCWQLVRIEGLKVMVHDAAGKPPTIPFWLGEAPGRSRELSIAVSRLRQTINDLLDKDPLPTMLEADKPLSDFALNDHRAVRWLKETVGMDEAAAEQLVIYLWMGKIGLGVMPTQQTIVMERFFDEAGDMHVVIHSPYGSRVNRGWGLALRKKFCRNFNFELQAAATENNIILSLSSSHSFPLEEVFRYLNTKILRETLIQAMLDAPLFEVRWRWNATRALAILRHRHGKRVPPYLQRMQAEDLIAQVFPDQIACLENIQGERHIPDHPLVQQVIHDCLTESMDIDTLEILIGQVERKELTLVAKDLREPSVFAQEIINARPYAFLDDTEFAERRVNAIRNRGWLDPGEARDLSRLDPAAIARVKQETWPQAETPDELHDNLMIHAFISQTEGHDNGWQALFADLVEQGRAITFFIQADLPLWVAVERLAVFKTVYPQAPYAPEVNIPEWLEIPASAEDALREIIRGRLEALGPVTISQMAKDCGLPETPIRIALLALENEGFVLRGTFTADLGAEEWCERRLLQRIHKYTIESLRESIQPVSLQDFMRFLLAHHHLRPDDEQTGPATLQNVLEQLEGFEAPAAAWETDIIPSRVKDYDPAWLDVLCMSGKIVWGRFHPPKPSDNGKKTGPVKSTPISLVPRSHALLWRGLASPHGGEKELNDAAQKIHNHLQMHGASFFDDLLAQTGLLKTQIEEGIAELVAHGLIVSDSYSGLRALLTPQNNKPSLHLSHRSTTNRRRYRQAVFGIEHAGRWSLMPNPPETKKDIWDIEILEKLIVIYLRRWGVVCRTLIEKESFAPPWRILVRMLRRLELRGELRGGLFIAQLSGEQFALPEIIETLRRMRQKPKTGELIAISAADPLNLQGILLPGKRIASLTTNRLIFRDGIPLAILEGKKVHYLTPLDPTDQWHIKKTLIHRPFPTKLRYYLGKRYG
jgi:ATP-dependent Lhr-like helicase